MLTKFLTIAVCLIAFSAGAFAQVSATATATATIVAPITITKDFDMNFGNVVTSAAIGTVLLVPAGTRTAGGGVSFMATQPGTVTAASFTVGGSAGFTFSITLPVSPAEDVTIDDNAAHTMTVSNFTSNPTPTGTIGGGGSVTLTVGATLNVGANQFPGVYSSDTPFSVTVNYN